MFNEFEEVNDLHDLVLKIEKAERDLKEAQYKMYNMKLQAVDFCVQNNLKDCLTVNVQRLKHYKRMG